jgi:2-polyprenyl-6-methoxyphenol hydroxylase-like FAD-dependent oxidoreductase
LLLRRRATTKKETAVYDVIIVGTRVAGAATALLLARRGLKVLAVDRATFPSDTLSTHQVQVPGCAALARWGLLDQVLAAGTPPTRTVRFDQGTAAFSASIREFEGVDLMCSPRRLLLDTILVDTARQAGAEVRDSFIAEELTRDATGTVTGLRGRTKGGPLVTEQARLTIGADGRHSLVARLTGAASYRTRPSRSMGCYTYWSGVPAQPGGQLYGRPGLAVGAWPTNDGLLMTYLAWPAARFAEFRRDVEGNFLRSLDEVGLGDRIRAGQRAERFRTAPDLPAWFRKPYGPGWALVGDAGLLMDPITGQGISDAFRDAELLAAALDDALRGRTAEVTALVGYEAARDEALGEVFDLTCALATFPPVPEFVELMRRLGRAIDTEAATLASRPVPGFVQASS